MFKKYIFTLAIVVISQCQVHAQFFPVDTARQNNSYGELTSHPNTLQRQQAFFEAFPNMGGR